MNSEPVKVLLIDDNPGDAVLVREALNAHAGMAFLIDDGDRLSVGLDKVRSHEYNIILLDLTLPDCQGLETFSKMKSLSQTHVFDRNNRDDWENNGKPSSYAKALSRAIEVLETHEPEPLPAGAAEHIRSIVEEAEKEVGVK